MSTTSTNSNQLQITNNTKVNFAVVDSVAKSPDASASQTLVQVLKLLKTTTGADSITQGTQASIILNDTYIDPTTGKEQPSLLYRLTFSTTDWLVPVNVKGVMQDLITEKYKPVVVAESDYEALQAAVQFFITINAYPTSDLAKNFNAAVSASTNTASQAQSGDDVTKGVNAFFKQTKDYTNVTFDMVTSVSSYFTTFPFVWARYQNAMTYYLYSSDGTNPTTYEGQLTMTRSASSSIPDVTDSNGGYKIVLTDANNVSTTLSYVNGQFLDNPKADIPSICLQGTFTLKSRLSGQSDDNQIISILSGSIKGKTVLGVDTRQSDDSTNKRSFWQTLFEPQGAQETFNSILQISGALFTLHFAYTTLKGIADWVRQKVTGKKPATLEEMIKKQTEDFQSAIKQNNAELIKKLTANQEKAPASIEAAENEISVNLDKLSAYGQKALLEAGIEAEAQRLETLAEALPEGPTPGLEKAAAQLRDIRDALEDATPETISKIVKSQSTQLDTIRQSITTEQAKAQEALDEETLQELADQKTVSDAIQEDLAKLNEDSASIEDGSIPDGEEAPEFPEIPIE